MKQENAIGLSGSLVVLILFTAILADPPGASISLNPVRAIEAILFILSWGNNINGYFLVVLSVIIYFIPSVIIFFIIRLISKRYFTNGT